MTGNLNRAFHRETVLGSGIGDERIAIQSGGIGLYAGIRVEVRSLNRDGHRAVAKGKHHENCPFC